MATVNIGTDDYVTFDKRALIQRTAVVTGGTGPTTFAWTFTSRPSGSAATLIGTTSQTAGFYPDKPGAYVVQCAIVNNSISSNDSATLIVRPTHWVRVSGVKRPTTMRAKTAQPSFITETVEETV